MKPRLAPIAATILLVGCGSIEQKVHPATASSGESGQICVIENAGVRHAFLESYEKALSARRFTVRVLPDGTGLDACPLTTTYAVEWRWDLALYVAYVDLRVYRNTRLDGEAVYDALNAGANTGKFVDADVKVQELTRQLFPG